MSVALCELHISNSQSLARMTSALAVIPEGKPGPFPVLYLLHGLWDDHTGWMRRSSIERYVDTLPIIVVMPNGDRGWYTDSPVLPTAQFESYIVQDLIPFIDNSFQTIPDRKGRAIAGLSMGGYGALKLALKHPEMFCAAAGHSPAVNIKGLGEREWAVSKAEYRSIFGDSPIGGPNDLFAIAESADRATLPQLRFDCGVDDYLIEDVRQFATHLTELCIPHEYFEYPGAHTWEYWDTHVQETVPWVCGHLGVERADSTPYDGTSALNEAP